MAELFTGHGDAIQERRQRHPDGRSNHLSVGRSPCKRCGYDLLTDQYDYCPACVNWLLDEMRKIIMIYARTSGELN